MPVTIREATYSRVELVTAARSLIDANKGVMTPAGPNHDFSAVAITLSSKAPETATASVKAQSPVPIEFRGVRTSCRSPMPPEGTPADPALTVPCHTATMMLEQGVDIRFVQKILGQIGKARWASSPR